MVDLETACRLLFRDGGHEILNTANTADCVATVGDWSQPIFWPDLRDIHSHPLTEYDDR
ncbi:hypothetical protein BH23ACT10_BH23ACT10_29190 [soil metagenome]